LPKQVQIAANQNSDAGVTTKQNLL